ncbi:sensor domain-containing diguanylate cyclase [Paludibacterium yongneupense]|uniref:sensor domain-containing diguanylate cyclase n=1 Tax=Paludibacterium yongneupense TaxID=400061 RepID=UPI00040C346A|nr:sensor domain-containing diguanylate cyclase [Paludibacterium yongneupense]
MKRGVSLRTFLIAPFLLLFLSGVVLIGWISYQNWQASAHQFERRLSDEIGQRIKTNLQQLFNSAATIAHVNRDLLQSRQMGVDDSLAQQRMFALQLYQMPYLTAISFGRPSNEFVAARRARQGTTVHVVLSGQRTRGVLQIYSTGSDDSARDLLYVGESPYDVTETAWFRRAVATGAPSWDDPDHLDSRDGLGFGIGAPVYGAGHALLGVAGVYVGEDQLSRFLEESQSSAHGLSFLMDVHGHLLATSDSSSLFEMRGGDLHRFSASESHEPRIAAAGRELKRSPLTGSRLISIGSENYLLNAIPYEGPDGLKLTIGVLLPEKDFSGMLTDNLRISGLLILLSVVIGTRFGIALTKRVSHPIEEINQYAAQLARGEWDGRPMPDSSVREINSLAHAFDGMAVSLQDMIDNLESRVVERTQELEVVNEKLARLASEDALTGIANRRCFNEVLEREWSRAQRERKPVALLLCDIDYFKAYNDNYGHHEGDMVLRDIARIIAAHARRPLDLAARYGGEEFALVLPGTHLAGALYLAEKLVQAVRDAELEHGYSRAGPIVTLSIGVAALYPLHGEASSRLIQLADVELYHAKDRGRNQVSPRIPGSLEVGS